MGWIPSCCPVFSLPVGICGALVQFGCYQHRYEWAKDLWCSSTVQLLSTQIYMEGSVLLYYSSAAINTDMNEWRMLPFILG